MVGERTNPLVNPKMVDAIATRLEASHDRNLGVRQEAMQQFIDALLESHEQDLAALVRPHVEHVANDETQPEAVRQLFSVLADPAHQTHFFTALFAIQGIINTFVQAALGPYVQELANTAWSHNPTMPLSPAELALGQLRGTLEGLDPYLEASYSGFDAKRLDILTLNTGEPPGLQQLLELYRRGELPKDVLEKGIRQSRVRNEWIPYVEELRYAPPSPAEAIRGAVQGHLDDTEARKKFMEGGYNPTNYEWMYETAGRPPGIMEMISLLNRGIIDEATVEQAIRESDIKDKYIGDIIQMRKHLVPQRTIISAIRQGVLTDAEADAKLAELGITPEDRVWLIKEGHSTKMQASREVSISVVKTLYADGVFDRPTAIDEIKLLGYDDKEADEILTVVDLLNQHRFRQAVITRTHTLFISYHIDKTRAVTTLDQLKIKPEERDALIEIWSLERETNAKTLTLAQLQGAVHRGIMTKDNFFKHAAQLGYKEADIPIVYDLSFPPSKFNNGVLTP